MSGKWDELHALDRALLEPTEGDGYSRFESRSLIREIKKSVARGDDEITLILAKAFCQKHLVEAVGPTQECIIYCRVSSEQQALGHGLTRQLKVCSDYARQKDYSIVAVFSEIQSGIDPLPIRATAERMAKKRKCFILCEDASRWSRKGDSDVAPATVIMASYESERLDANIRALLEMHTANVRAGVSPPQIDA